jgi:hypothetical protein
MRHNSKAACLRGRLAEAIQLRGSKVALYSKVWIRQQTTVASLKPVLKSWVERSFDYCRSHGFEDNPWWYNERASLSVLAAAAWTTKGWCALEEYATTKQGDIPPSKADSGSVRSGRCDLWIGNRTGYAVEAKQAWQSIGPGATGENARVWRQFALAHKDAGSLTCDEADRRVAALFVSPYVPVSKVLKADTGKQRLIDRDKVCELTTKWRNEIDLESNKRVAGYAWIFPDRCDLFVSKDGRNLFPGALLLLGERKRANRRSRT